MKKLLLVLALFAAIGFSSQVMAGVFIGVGVGGPGYYGGGYPGCYGAAPYGYAFGPAYYGAYVPAYTYYGPSYRPYGCYGYGYGYGYRRGGYGYRGAVGWRGGYGYFWH